MQTYFERTTGKQLLTKEVYRKQRKNYEIRKQKEDNHKERVELEQLAKPWETDGKRCSGIGADLAARRSQSRRCREGRESAMDIEDLWVARQNTMYGCEKDGKPIEDNAKMEGNEIKSNQPWCAWIK